MLYDPANFTFGGGPNGTSILRGAPEEKSEVSVREVIYWVKILMAWLWNKLWWIIMVS